LTRVIDAGVVVAALVDGGRTGRWAESLLVGGHLSAPHLMPIEAANVLRRAWHRGDVSPDVASLAHADLSSLRVELFQYETVAMRAWAHRANLTIYDACYVALAEILDAELVTLDRRLARAPGVECRFALPPE
jgi:predicted nucleic acid-binding protein